MKKKQMLYVVLLFMFLRGKAILSFLSVPMHVNAQRRKGLEKDLELEEVIKKDFTLDR